MRMFRTLDVWHSDFLETRTLEMLKFWISDNAKVQFSRSAGPMLS